MVNKQNEDSWKYYNNKLIMCAEALSFDPYLACFINNYDSIGHTLKTHEDTLYCDQALSGIFNLIGINM